MNKKIIAVMTSAALGLGGMVAMADQADAATSGYRTCTTGKGKLWARDYWAPNVKTTLHQVDVTRKAKVKGKTWVSPTYELYSIKVSNKAKVTWNGRSYIYQVPRNKKVNVTVTWRADKPLTAGKQWMYASCTMKVG